MTERANRWGAMRPIEPNEVPGTNYQPLLNLVSLMIALAVAMVLTWNDAWWYGLGPMMAVMLIFDTVVAIVRSRPRSTTSSQKIVLCCGVTTLLLVIAGQLWLTGSPLAVVSITAIVVAAAGGVVFGIASSH